MNRYCFLHEKTYPFKDGCADCNLHEDPNIVADLTARVILLEKKIQELYDRVKVN